MRVEYPDWEYLESSGPGYGDSDSRVPCHCRHCESEGYYPAGPDCLYCRNPNGFGRD